jgi:hypothetical protein
VRLAVLLFSAACSRSSSPAPTADRAVIPATASPSAPSATPAASLSPSANPAAPNAAPTAWAVPTVGEPYALEVGEVAASFCDARGAREVDLHTGKDSPAPQTCPKKKEPNGACAGLPLEVTVETPGGGPKDVVFAGGWGFHPEGRVHDCAADGNMLAIVTGMTVELLNTATGTATTVDGKAGGERVAVGHRWVVWSDGGHQVHGRSQ